MKAPISGIVTGFRIKKGNGKDSSDFAQLDILQPGDKNDESTLDIVYVQDLSCIEQLLNHYSNGQLRWINIFAKQILNGRETVWLLTKIFSLSQEQILVSGSD